MRKLVSIVILSFAGLLPLGAVGCSTRTSRTRTSRTPATTRRSSPSARSTATPSRQGRRPPPEAREPALLRGRGQHEPEDDIDFDGLKDYLTSTFVKTQTIRYEIRYRKVTFNENKKIYIEYTYSASYRIPA